jgi:hypothetical protein
MVRAVRSWIPVVGLLALGAAACDQTAVTLPEATSLSVSPEAMSMVEGETSAVSAHVLDQRGQVLRNADASWSSSQPSVASVTADGTVTARSEGTATLTASYGGQTANVNVTVGARASTIAVSHSEVEVHLDEQQGVQARVLDPAGRPIGQPAMWTSDDESIATVSQGGMVYGRAIGETTIRAHYGNLVREIPVEVTHRPAVEWVDFYLSQDDVTLYTNVSGATWTDVSAAAVTEEGRTICPSISATSADRSIATVSQFGTCTVRIYAQFPGETIVTISAGDFSEDVSVTVERADEYVNFWSETPDWDEMLAGETVSYSVTFLDTEGEPLVGQAVNFDVQRGSLATSTVTTDADGVATVEWTLPTNLRVPGSTNSPWIQYRAELPNGVLRSGIQYANVRANEAATIEVRYQDYDENAGWYWTDWMALDASVTLETGNWYWFNTRSFDEYGNNRSQFGYGCRFDHDAEPGDVLTWSSTCGSFEVRSNEEQDATVTITDGDYSADLNITFEVADDE